MGLPKPITRQEQYLAKAAGEDVQTLPDPITREEMYLKAIAENGGGGGGTQIQSDWNQTNSSKVDFIKNKPTITPQIQSDWEQSDNTKADYIKNKPTIPAEVTVDDEMSDSSENPVQNKVIKAYVDAARGTVTNHGIVL